MTFVLIPSYQNFGVAYYEWFLCEVFETAATCEPCDIQKEAYEVVRVSVEVIGIQLSLLSLLWGTSC